MAVPNDPPPNCPPSDGAAGRAPDDDDAEAGLTPLDAAGDGRHDRLPLLAGLVPEDWAWGKDELNMAEYPLSLAGKTLGQRRASIARFNDSIRDRATGRVIERTVTITGAVDLGLPTYYDEEVLFGIMQLTHHQRGPDGAWPVEVVFSRYQLARLLGLKHGGSSYRRLKNSIDRLVSTTYRFEYAFFDKEREAWKPGLTINFIQSAEYFAGNGRAAGRGAFGDVAVRWHDAVHRNFEAGYLRDINFLEYRTMRLPLAKALYRYLGKHFHRSPRLDRDLRTLAHEKLGLSRAYDIGQIKRALAPALARLEERGYIVPEPPGRRYDKLNKGQWQIRFERAGPARSPRLAGPGVPLVVTELEQALIAAGVGRTAAAELVADHPAEVVTGKLDALRWLAESGDPPKNPGGFLAASIREGWADPAGYEPPEARLARARAEREQHERRGRAKLDAGRREAELAGVIARRTSAARAHLDAMPETDRAALAAEVLGDAPTLFQQRRRDVFLLAEIESRLEAAGAIPPLPGGASPDAAEAEGGSPRP